MAENFISCPPENNTYKLRKRITVEAHLSKYNSLIELLDNEISKLPKTATQTSTATINNITFVMKDVKKQIKEMRDEAVKLTKCKQAKKKKNSGLTMSCNLSQEMINFLHVPEGTKLSRNEITNAICTYIYLNPNETRKQILRWSYLNTEGRDLRNPHKKTEIIPDEVISELLGYEMYIKNVQDGLIMGKTTDKITKAKVLTTVTNTALTYRVIQKLICKHIV